MLRLKMEKEANLLVSFEPSHLEAAKQEIISLLEEIGEKAEILLAEQGLAEVLVNDARKAVQELSKIADSDIAKFSYTLQWSPVDKWCKHDIEEIKAELKKLAEKIASDEKWKMELKVRRVKEKPDMHELIIKLTEVIDRKNVDLENPEKIVKVEIIGDKTALALLKPEEILNIAKKKQG